MVEKVKQLRMEIDGIASTIGRIHQSKELSEAKDCLLLSKAWLGKILGVLGTMSPYPKDGERHTVKDIEPTADTGDIVDAIITLNHVEKVDTLRQLTGKLYDDLMTMAEKLPAFHFEQVAKYLIEARFWLGFELQRFKNE